MSFWKRLLECILAAVLMILLSAGSARPVSAEETGGQEKIKAGDILCFGTPDEACGFDGKWLVLDSEQTNTGGEGMFLVSLSLIGGEKGESLLFRDIGDVTVSFSDRGEAYAADHPGATDYQGSDIQRWCADFLAGHFSEAEQEAMLPTYKSDEGIAVPGFGVPLPGISPGTVDFDPAENILAGDRLFLLSAEEAVSEKYGFTDNQARVALFKGTAEGYWLRSPHIPTFPLDVGFVYSFGAVMDYPVNARSMFSLATYARPACNISRDMIAGLELLSAAGGAGIWRVTFEGDGRNERVYDPGLPAVGKVPDVQRMLSAALIAIPVLILVLVAVLIRLAVKHIRKKRMLSRCGKGGPVHAVLVK